MPTGDGKGPAGAPETRLCVAAISDALDRLDISGQVHGLRPVAGVGSRALSGPAFTVRLVPRTGGAGTVGDFIDDVPAGHVVVLDNGGRTDVTVWGDLLTRTAIRRGLGGTVIHGACRDVDVIGPSGYPVFSRGWYMRTGKGRVRVAGVNEVVSLGSAAVRPGDTIVGGADGVLVVPAERADEVLAAAASIEEAEAVIRERIDSGARLDEARRAVGYHQLQSGDP